MVPYGLVRMFLPLGRARLGWARNPSRVRGGGQSGRSGGGVRHSVRDDGDGVRGDEDNPHDGVRRGVRNERSAWSGREPPCFLLSP